MDRAFNLVHGVGAQLNSEMKLEPIKTTTIEIKRRCPDVQSEVIELFTKIKYLARIKAINEQQNLAKKADLKRKAAERKETPRKIQQMGDFIKTGHFSAS